MGSEVLCHRRSGLHPGAIAPDHRTAITETPQEIGRGVAPAKIEGT